jgi:hypothetical protein
MHALNALRLSVLGGFGGFSVSSAGLYVVENTFRFAFESYLRSQSLLESIK